MSLGSFASAGIDSKRARPPVSPAHREYAELHARLLDRFRRHSFGKFRRAKQGPPARHDSAALHGHARCARARSRSSAPRAPTSRHITSFWKTAASSNACPKPSAPGTPASPSWAGEDDINSCSIGIEIVNRGHDWGYPEFPLRQIAAVIALCRGIMLRRNVPSHRVLAHSDVAPSRKKDPGEKFPWHSLANSGVGHWVQPAPIVRSEGLKLGTISDEVRNLQQALARYGYGMPITGKYDTTTMEVVTAFQRHFRPAKVDGIADHSTLMTLQVLLASLPAQTAAVAAG